MIASPYQWLSRVFIVTFCMASQIHATEFLVHDTELQDCIKKLATLNQWKHAKDATKIECHSHDIQSLLGLEQFINLEVLSLYNNKLKDIDIKLTTFKKLNTLNLARNNIHRLTISELPALNTVYLFDNGMRSLTLKNLLNLKVLKANNNKIESFIYSNTPALQKVYIFNNQLETVNIYNLPSLLYMDCRQNPMPDSLYDQMDQQDDVSFLHDGNAEDW